MKQSALALAALAVLSLHTSATAQDSVQLDGRVDAGVELVNHAGDDVGSLVRVISGGKNTSRWGLRGSENLGAGDGQPGGLSRDDPGFGTTQIGVTAGVRHRF